MTKTTRPRLGIALMSVALVASCGGDKKPTPTTTTASSSSTAPATTSASVSTSTSASSSSTSTTVPAGDTSIAVWPLPTGDVRFGDPVAAARSFAVSFLHMAAPIVGAFRQGDSRSGEVPVQPGSRGPVTTVLVRRLGADASWWVIGSSTPNIVLVSPGALAAIASPVRLRGTSTAFEATVDVSIREDGGATPLAETYTTGGANGTMGPFDTSVAFRHPTKPAGSIVMYTRSPEDGHVSEASVVRVRFAGM